MNADKSLYKHSDVAELIIPYEVGLLLNFGPKPEIRRRAFDNTHKGTMKWLYPEPTQ